MVGRAATILSEIGRSAHAVIASDLAEEAEGVLGLHPTVTRCSIIDAWIALQLVELSVVCVGSCGKRSRSSCCHAESRRAQCYSWYVLLL